MASEGRVWAGRDREHGQRRTRQKEGRSEKEEHLTLCLAACRTQLILDAAPANPRRAACVNKRIERVGVLVTWSSVRSSRFSSTVPFCFTSLQLIPPPYHFLSLSAVLERFSVPSLCKYSYSHSKFSTRFTQLPFSNFVSLSFPISRYVNRPVFVSNSVINSHAVTRDSRTIHPRDVSHSEKLW